MEFSSVTVHYTLVLVGHVVSSAYWLEFEFTLTLLWLLRGLEVRYSASSVVGELDSGALSEAAKVGVGYSVNTADWVEVVVALRALLVAGVGSSVSVSFGLVRFRLEVRLLGLAPSSVF